MNTFDILEKLISFNTVSINSNIKLIDYVVDLLNKNSIEFFLDINKDKTKSNLLAYIGPEVNGGILLSGHTDVVPTEGQTWNKPAFKLTEDNGLLYGRGTADMKSFIACSINNLIQTKDKKLTKPLYLALSYDEEIGCVGVRSLIKLMSNFKNKPEMCIIGEPTSMQIATGHKGKTGILAECFGKEAHSAHAPLYVNSINLASEFIAEIKKIQNKIIYNGNSDNFYKIPYTTIHVGKIFGGIALNIVPKYTTINFEIRNIFTDNPKDIIKEIKSAIKIILKEAKKISKEANIKLKITNEYPYLETNINNEIVTFMKQITGKNNTIKVDFGTEGGLFSDRLTIPTIVCGPGSMEQGHKPDEFISRDQINECDRILNKISSSLI